MTIAIILAIMLFLIFPYEIGSLLMLIAFCALGGWIGFFIFLFFCAIPVKR